MLKREKTTSANWKQVWGMCLIALCTSGIPARSHLKLISVQHLTLSLLLKIDAAVITRISSHHDNSLGLGCYRNLRFIRLWLQKHRTGGKEEKKNPDEFFFFFFNLLPVPMYLLLRGKKGLGRGGRRGYQVKHVKTWEENRGGEIQGLFFGLATRTTLVSSYWNNKNTLNYKKYYCRKHIHTHTHLHNKTILKIIS